VDRKNRTAAMQALAEAGEDMKKKGVSLNIHSLQAAHTELVLPGIFMDLPGGDPYPQT
jgi:hypothetical protein